MVLLAIAFCLTVAERDPIGCFRPIASQFCLTVAERDLARDAMLDGLDMALRLQVRKLIDVRHRDRANDPARILSGLQGSIAAYAASRRAVLQWSPVLCQPLPTPRPNTG